MDREEEFNNQLAAEVSKNNAAIKVILANSRVGECGGKCGGYKEPTPDDLCDDCRQALEENAAEIFSVSPLMRLLGTAMDRRD